MQKDMTTGNVNKTLLSFSLPIFAGNVFQQLYSMVDTIIVGKFVGTKPLAAVGSVGTIMFLILGFAMGMTAGFAVLTARYFGMGRQEDMRKSIGSAFTLSLILTVILTVISMAGMRSLLTLMHTPSDIFQDAYDYIMIICAGILASVMYNLLASILRAVGDSRTPLLFLLLSAVLNIVLDLLFIITFGMRVKGAAYATVISQGVSSILCLIYMWKKFEILRFRLSDCALRWREVSFQLRVGLPMALQFSITAIGTMMVQSSLNLLGSMAVAGFTAGSKIEQLVVQAYPAIGVAMTSYCAQNLGANRYDRIRQGFRATTYISLIYSVAIGIPVFFFGQYATRLFVSDNLAEIMRYTDVYLKCTTLLYFPLAIVNIYRNAIQGLGYGLLPMMSGVMELAARGAVAVWAAGRGDFYGVCLASPVAWVAACLLLVGMYFYVMRGKPKTAPQKTN